MGQGSAFDLVFYFSPHCEAWSQATRAAIERSVNVGILAEIS